MPKVLNSFESLSVLQRPLGTSIILYQMPHFKGLNGCICEIKLIMVIN